MEIESEGRNAGKLVKRERIHESTYLLTAKIKKKKYHSRTCIYIYI